MVFTTSSFDNCNNTPLSLNISLLDWFFSKIWFVELLDATWGVIFILGLMVGISVAVETLRQQWEVNHSNKKEHCTIAEEYVGTLPCTSKLRFDIYIIWAWNETSHPHWWFLNCFTRFTSLSGEWWGSLFLQASFHCVHIIKSAKSTGEGSYLQQGSGSQWVPHCEELPLSVSSISWPTKFCLMILM